ncbi:MAG TPA: MarR family transcriptional regulator [Myxococcales bacterium]|jgi:DNA-binding MarR family transcriptional regulator
MDERNDLPDVARLIELFKGLMQAARPSEAALALMLRLELTLPQILSMARMRQTAQTVSALATELRLTPGAVSRLIDQLVGKGLVRRAEGEEDRRCKRLTLTPAGVEALDQLDGARQADLARMLGRIPPGLRADLAGVLERIVASVGPQPEAAP